MNNLPGESADQVQSQAPGQGGPSRLQGGLQKLGSFSTWKELLLRPEMALPLVTAAAGVYLSFASPYFLQRQNLLNITEAVSVIGIAAAFATVVVISGGIDLTPVTVMIVDGHRRAADDRSRPAGGACRGRGSLAAGVGDRAASTDC